MFNPTFDGETNTVTYDVEPLANWSLSLEMGFSEAPIDLAELVPEFGAAHVFIDDCPDISIMCVRPDSEAYGVLGRRGMCWRDFWCHMCFPEQYTRECNETFDKICQGKCQAEVQVI